eukprot:COSAG01_NODE_1482_length_10160_cov_12.513567_11_plen_182_part_00
MSPSAHPHVQRWRAPCATLCVGTWRCCCWGGLQLSCLPSVPAVAAVQATAAAAGRRGHVQQPAPLPAPPSGRARIVPIQSAAAAVATVAAVAAAAVRPPLQLRRDDRRTPRWIRRRAPAALTMIMPPPAWQHPAAGWAQHAPSPCIRYCSVTGSRVVRKPHFLEDIPVRWTYSPSQHGYQD